MVRDFYEWLHSFRHTPTNQQATRRISHAHTELPELLSVRRLVKTKERGGPCCASQQV